MKTLSEIKMYNKYIGQTERVTDKTSTLSYTHVLNWFGTYIPYKKHLCLINWMTNTVLVPICNLQHFLKRSNQSKRQ